MRHAGTDACKLKHYSVMPHVQQQLVRKFFNMQQHPRQNRTKAKNLQAQAWPSYVMPSCLTDARSRACVICPPARRIHSIRSNPNFLPYIIRSIYHIYVKCILGSVKTQTNRRAEGKRGVMFHHGLDARPPPRAVVPLYLVARANGFEVDVLKRKKGRPVSSCFENRVDVCFRQCCTAVVEVCEAPC